MVRVAWRFVVVLVAGAGLLTLLAGGARMAQAEPVDCASQTHSVAIAAELDAAIQCHNAGTEATTITLQADILYGANLGVAPITQDAAGADLSIDGDGFAIIGQPVAGASNDMVDITGAATVTLADIGIDGAGGSNIYVRDTAGSVVLTQLSVTNAFGNGITVDGGLVSLTDAISANNGSVGLSVSGGEVTATTSLFESNGQEGIVVLGGRVDIADSTVVTNAASGIATVAGDAQVTNTTVTSNAADAVMVRGGSFTLRSSTVDNNAQAGVTVENGVALVSNSTLTRNDGEGVLVNGGDVIVSNSSVLRNGLQGIGQTAGAVEAISSIVVLNSQGLSGSSDCRGEVADGGNNFIGRVSSCLDARRFFGGARALSDNGCGVPQRSVDGVRCAQTVQIHNDSTSTHAGRCTGVPVGISGGQFVYGDLLFDQRGSGDSGSFDRTIGPACDAGAFETDSIDQCGSTWFEARTPQELDEAITCYNGQSPVGDYYISLDGSIAYPAGTGAERITQNDPGHTLTIGGRGTVSGSDSTIFLFEVAGRGGVRFAGVNLAGAPEISIGLRASAGELHVERSSISGARLDGLVMWGGSASVSDSVFSDADQWGILVNGGELNVSNSIFTGNLFAGIDMRGGTGVVTNSSFVRNANFGVSASGGTLLVSNSTIASNGTGGANAAGGDLVIANSTVTDNGRIGLMAPQGAVRVVSSIVAGNNADTTAANTADCDGAVVDLGNSFASDGSCAGFGIITPSPGSLEGPADYGCDTPVGPYPSERCGETVRLVTNSSAADSGICSDVPVGLDDTTLVYGDVPADQRGTDGRFSFPRTIGAACDAGAFESDTNIVNVCTTNSWLVTTAHELDQAINCYNNQTPAGDHTITLANSISYEPQLGSREIAQSEAERTLTIDGAGFSVAGSRADDGRFPEPLFTVSGDGGVVVSDITIVDAPNDAVRLTGGQMLIQDTVIINSYGYAITHSGGSRLQLVNSSLVSNEQRGLGVGRGTVEVSNVVMHGNRFGGIYVGQNAELTVDRTTISDGSIGIAMYDEADSSSIAVSNSTLASLEVGMTVSGGSVVVSNSTIAGNRDFGLGVSGGDVTVASSIVAGNATGAGGGSNCAGPIGDGGANFSSDDTCQGFTSLRAGSLGPLVDNGCEQVLAYPGGPTCVATRALLRSSNAIDAGTCDAVTTDQRGFARVVGANCDSGAYELQLDDSASAGLAGTLWIDLNEDGLRQDGEWGLEGWQVDLLRSDGTEVVNGGTATDANGDYDFATLAAGTYTVSVALPSTGDYFTLADAGDDSFDSDVAPAGDLVVVLGAEQSLRVDAGVVDGTTGDANCDGVLNILDAYATAQYVVGLREATSSCLTAPPPPTGQISLGAVIDVSSQQDATSLTAFRVSQCVVGIDNALCPVGLRELSDP